MKLAPTVQSMYVIKEKDLDCGCCIELEVTHKDKTVKIVCHSAEEGLEEAKKLLFL